MILARAADINKQKRLGNQLPSQVVFNMLVGKASTSKKAIVRSITVGQGVLTITERDRKVIYELDALSKDKLLKIENFIAAVMGD